LAVHGAAASHGKNRRDTKRGNIPYVLALRLSIFNEEWANDWQ